MTHRLHKTGDIGEICSDGIITLTGRKDHQVKVDEQRVELGEIGHHIHRVLPIRTESAVGRVNRDANDAVISKKRSVEMLSVVRD